LKLNHDEPLSNFAFNISLRHYAKVTTLPTDWVAGTGMASQVMTLFRRHGLLSKASQIVLATSSTRMFNPRLLN